MRPVTAKRLRLLSLVVGGLVLLAAVAGGWFYSRLRASLPQLEGSATVTGLGAPVTVERDAQGVPSLRGQNRADLSRALGWLHAQERFFQMDLLRRSAAGELAEVFGAAAVPRDRAARLHGFRLLAQTVLQRLPADQRTQLDAYTAGVNAGLAALREKPFEYLVLRVDPKPWRAEDSVLVVYAMTMDLQDPTNRYEQTLMVLRDTLGEEAVAFFAPVLTPNDAALDGSKGTLAPMPGPQTIDLRKRPKPAAISSLTPVAKTTPALAANFPFPVHDPETVLGSNALALSGAHTATGAALLANDPHLRLAVPNTWYRASLEWPEHKVTGVTLPGLFAVVIGSNGHIAWGLTVSYADTGDLIVLQTAPLSPSLYIAPGHDGSIRLEKRTETILVKGGDAVSVEYDWSIWGPVVATNDKKRPVVQHWTAHDPNATNFHYLKLEDAVTVAEAVAAAHRSGMPAHNFLVVDAAGDIAWTIAGVLPQRIGYDGRLPTSWAFGDRRWEGLLPPDEIPVVTTKSLGLAGEIMTPDGRLWSGNQRQLGGPGLVKLGDGGFNRPARSAQLRDGLAPLERATPKDLLAVQLDDRALFLAPWQKLLVSSLTPAATAEKTKRVELKALAEKWEGHATVDSVSYRLAREYRTAVYQRVFPAIFAPCLEAEPKFFWTQLQLEGPVWALLREKPAHLLNPAFASWDALLVAAADDVIAKLDKEGTALDRATWGRRNTARIRHPFSLAMPAFLTGWLNMPATPLPGDNDMPRVQNTSDGASMRMVVSPGREAEGIFHMPGGQSGHPLSPYYRAGHSAWERGEPTPFLPGKTEHRLELKGP
jgi:penicillin amidase